MVYNLTVKNLLTAASRACVLSALFFYPASVEVKGVLTEKP